MQDGAKAKDKLPAPGLIVREIVEDLIGAPVEFEAVGATLEASSMSDDVVEDSTSV